MEKAHAIPRIAVITCRWTRSVDRRAAPAAAARTPGATLRNNAFDCSPRNPAEASSVRDAPPGRPIQVEMRRASLTVA